MDVLQEMMTSYNLSYHSSIKCAPADVSVHNEAIVRSRLFKPKILPVRWKFDKGDKVRISRARRTFRKGYLPSWTEEIFKIVERVPTDPPTYKISDYDGEVVEGKFYEPELQRVIKIDDTYKVETVLKTRKRAGRLEYYVKWLGYPAKFNSWTSDIIT
jgi:hypothetical protein